MKKIKILSVVLYLLLVVASCAKRGTITGGDKDISPPKIVSSSPKNLSTNFTTKTIKITFNEYIKIKDLQKQLIVSPLMKTPATILPQGGASKYITIKINDTLQPNTTYSFNFGQSIVDNNEGNPYRQLKYVFSTGNFIDSLSIEGIIKDSYEKKIPNFVNVMLYEVDQKYNDSVVFKKTPRYVTNTLDSLTIFKIDNIKAGNYKLVAIKETNNNYKFDPKKEKIGFYNKTITIPDKAIFELELFKEVTAFKAKRPSQVSGNKLLLAYEGDAENLKITAKQNNKAFAIKVTKIPEKDSLNIWFAPMKNDSIALHLENDKYKEDYTVKIRSQKKDTLKITPKQSNTLSLKEHFIINSSNPIEKFDLGKMSLTKKDKSKVTFKTKYDDFNQTMAFLFEKEPNEKYLLKMEPKAIEDYLGQTSDSLSFSFNTNSTADYGNLKLTLQNVKSFPIIVELTDETGKVIETQYSDKKTTVEFLLIEPKKYSLRVIYDLNKNKKRDTGHFLQQLQPEEVIHFPSEIDIRANWDVDQTFDLALIAPVIPKEKDKPKNPIKK
jgi:uncharacterized protein (DUF2141 family)